MESIFDSWALSVNFRSLSRSPGSAGSRYQFLPCNLPSHRGETHSLYRGEEFSWAKLVIYIIDGLVPPDFDKLADLQNFDVIIENLKIDQFI
jgi:hypothetical protein